MARTITRRRSGEQRLRIIKKASELFRERGYRGVTVDDIARAVGVSKLGIYYYLDSKEEILYEVHRMAHAAVLRAWQDAAAGDKSPAEKLRTALRSNVDIICSEMSFTTSLLLHLYDLPTSRRRSIVRMRDAVEKMARSFIAAGIKTGEFEPCDPKLATFAIFGAINFMPHWYSPQGQLSKQTIIDSFVDYLMRGLLSSAGGKTSALPTAISAPVE